MRAWAAGGLEVEEPSQGKAAASLGRWGFHVVARIFSFPSDRTLNTTTLLPSAAAAPDTQL